MPRKIRELMAVYGKLGAQVNLRKGKGSHRKITHPDVPGSIVLSGKSGDDAHHYMEKTLKEFEGKLKDSKKNSKNLKEKL